MQHLKQQPPQQQQQPPKPTPEELLNATQNLLPEIDLRVREILGALQREKEELAEERRQWREEQDKISQSKGPTPVQAQILSRSTTEADDISRLTQPPPAYLPYGSPNDFAGGHLRVLTVCKRKEDHGVRTSGG